MPNHLVRRALHLLVFFEMAGLAIEAVRLVLPAIENEKRETVGSRTLSASTHAELVVTAAARNTAMARRMRTTVHPSAVERSVNAPSHHG